MIAIVGRRLSRALRGKDRIGRFSSNKFLIIPHEGDPKGVEAIARRLIAAVRESVVELCAR